MRKFGFILFFFVLVFIAFCHNSETARAADSAFNFTYLDQSFSVKQSELDSWQGEQAVAPSKILPPIGENLMESLSALVGQPVTPKVPVLIYSHNLDKIYNYITGLSSQINLDPEEPVLNINSSGQVDNFIPPQIGRRVDVYQSSLATLRALELGRNSLELTVYQNAPKNNLSDTNNLGIKELVAEGVSNFKGSPKNRRHNITVGVEKFKGIIIPQGATFSFNDNLGPVDAEHGFLPELVIKKEGTIPEFGGGLCQVSSTAFRAAMAAGMPITARRNHAYAVQYYSPQGTDATIYPGSADLKFINDTPGAILIWPFEKDDNTLIFDFYGTKDGRQVTLEKPVVFDRKPDGSMKATWTREVVSPSGELKTDVFKSTYQSPALFHKTEQFVTAPVLAPTLNPAPIKVQ